MIVSREATIVKSWCGFFMCRFLIIQNYRGGVIYKMADTQGQMQRERWDTTKGAQIVALHPFTV